MTYSDAITVESLSKAFRLGLKNKSPDTLIGAVSGLVKNPIRNFNRLRSLSRINEGDEASDILWALRDVNFSVKPGEVVGILGRNGAGKSTLLKILSRITQPTGGRVRIRGRVSSLLEVGTGFHPELTGRENIYMNGTILGMTKSEIDRKFDQIVDFSGVEKFLDTPTKRYSSGMQVRLAFAVAAHLQPEILIIDEVLAVGDSDFQKKCLGAMKDVSESGRTVLFVSHNMSAIQRLCSRSILIRSGTVELDSTTDEVVSSYLRGDVNENHDLTLLPRKKKIKPIISGLRLLNDEGNAVSSATTSEPLRMRIEFQHTHSLEDPLFEILIETDLGQRLLFLQTGLQCPKAPDQRESGWAECRIPSLPLLPGHYHLSVGIKIAGVQVDVLERVKMLAVNGDDPYGTGNLPPTTHGSIVAECDWEFSSQGDKSTVFIPQ